MNSSSAKRIKCFFEGLWEYSPLLLALSIALAVGLFFIDHGTSYVGAALAGSVAGVLITYFICFWTYRIRMFLTRGAPFRAGHRVTVTAGKQSGLNGIVMRICSNETYVVVALEGHELEPKVFQWEELRKVTKGESDQRSNGHEERNT